MSKIRVGITLRTIETLDYVEPRDAIAQDWYRFLADLKFEWVLIPNIGPKVIEYIKRIEINAFILTGGNDVGESPLRDLTETHILDYASKLILPVIGICRGMQMIHMYFGGKLSQIDDRSHIAKIHKVIIQELQSKSFPKNFVWNVNSFHGQGIATSSVESNFKITALSDDGWVEAFKHISLPIYGLMWHPERFHPSRKEEQKLFKYFLCGDET